MRDAGGRRQAVSIQAIIGLHEASRKTWAGHNSMFAPLSHELQMLRWVLQQPVNDLGAVASSNCR